MKGNYPAQTKMINQDKKEIKINARKLLRKGRYTVYSIVRHVSNSGMSRVIDFFVIVDNKPRNITYLMEDLLDYKYDKYNSGIKVGGCGMDMCFHCVYSLSGELYKTSPNHESDGGYKLNSKNI